MKKSLRQFTDSPIKAATLSRESKNLINTRTFICTVFLFSLCILTACKKNAGNNPVTDEVSQSAINNVLNSGPELFSNNIGLSPQTLFELQQAKAATAKYQNISNAIADKYVDINLVMPNMGYHFLKSELITPQFDFKKPSILVYNKKDNGNFELIALEYAVPIDPQTPNTPPIGFTGEADVWDFNTLNTGWWTLHAWVWKNNPAGVFNPTNPLVIVQ